MSKVEGITDVYACVHETIQITRASASNSAMIQPAGRLLVHTMSLHNTHNNYYWTAHRCFRQCIPNIENPTYWMAIRETFWECYIKQDCHLFEESAVRAIRIRFVGFFGVFHEQMRLN